MNGIRRWPFTSIQKRSRGFWSSLLESKSKKRQERRKYRRCFVRKSSASIWKLGRKKRSSSTERFLNGQHHSTPTTSSTCVAEKHTSTESNTQLQISSQLTGRSVMLQRMKFLWGVLSRSVDCPLSSLRLEGLTTTLSRFVRSIWSGATNGWPSLLSILLVSDMEAFSSNQRGPSAFAECLTMGKKWTQLKVLRWIQRTANGRPSLSVIWLLKLTT